MSILPDAEIDDMGGHAFSQEFWAGNGKRIAFEDLSINCRHGRNVNRQAASHLQAWRRSACAGWLDSIFGQSMHFFNVAQMLGNSSFGIEIKAEEGGSLAVLEKFDSASLQEKFSEFYFLRLTLYFNAYWSLTCI